MTATQKDRHEKNPSEVVIDIKGLTKDYQVGFLKKKTVRALDDLTIEVRRGDIFGFLGPNGAGKTTTLKLLMRLIYPTEGSATILGNPIDDVATRSRIGYLPENPYFYDYLSGRELLHYTARLFAIEKTVAERRAADLLEMVGLDKERADRQLRKYSKGMLQRIGIAQALVNDPEIVFMDEPMSGLDPIGRREVRDLMLSLREQNKTIFFSSHILSDVEALCDRAAILSRGKLVRYGTVEELTAHEGSSLEVIVVGVETEILSASLRAIPAVEAVNATPNGAQIILQDETNVASLVALIHEAGGKLVSINPRRTSLEDIFTTANQTR
ncbi:MAG TPA: ABC transporter ATP-binding protein [Blastocatellia bacterium]|nr:ABC transporter ATP-binding protein [Blastocatellia bacterium]